MTDIAAAEVPAELEAATPEATALAEKPDQAQAEAEALTTAPEFAGASTSQLVVDRFIDSEGDQTIARIIAGLGGTVSRNTVESAVRRLYEAGRLLRVSRGTYRLAPETPAGPREPRPSPSEDEALLFAALEVGPQSCFLEWTSSGRLPMTRTPRFRSTSGSASSTAFAKERPADGMPRQPLPARPKLIGSCVRS